MNFIDTYNVGNSTRMLISLVVKMILLHDWLIEYQLMIEMLLSLSFFPIFFSIFYVYCIGTVVLLFDGPNECCSFAHLACCKTQIVLFVDLTVCDGICCSLSLSLCTHHCISLHRLHRNRLFGSRKSRWTKHISIRENGTIFYWYQHWLGPVVIITLCHMWFVAWREIPYTKQ